MCIICINSKNFIFMAIDIQTKLHTELRRCSKIRFKFAGACSIACVVNPFTCPKAECSPDQQILPCRIFSCASSSVKSRPTGKCPAVLLSPERSRASSRALPDRVIRLPGEESSVAAGLRGYDLHRSEPSVMPQIAVASATFSTLREQILKDADHSPHRRVPGLGFNVSSVAVALNYSPLPNYRPQSPIALQFYCENMQSPCFSLTSLL